MQYKYIFGPVPSRRLGISLGIDLLPYKTCSFSCIYCECGATTHKTRERKEYVPTNAVIAELADYLAKSPPPDFITFSGSGEPTLHTGIGEIIAFLKKNYPNQKIAVLTNASLLSDAEVRRELSAIDLLVPTLNGATMPVFKKISRPAKGITPDEIADGLQAFQQEFAGKMHLALFILEGLNTDESELLALKKQILQIKPDLVQLNSLDRPPAESFVKPTSKETLEKIIEFLNLEEEAKIPVKIISKYRSRREIRSYREDIEQAILGTIARRPCTIEDLEAVLGLNRLELDKYIDVLEKEGSITTIIEKRGIFYSLKKD